MLQLVCLFDNLTIFNILFFSFDTAFHRFAIQLNTNFKIKYYEKNVFIRCFVCHFVFVFLLY